MNFVEIIYLKLIISSLLILSNKLNDCLVKFNTYYLII